MPSSSNSPASSTETLRVSSDVHLQFALSALVQGKPVNALAEPGAIFLSDVVEDRRAEQGALIPGAEHSHRPIVEVTDSAMGVDARHGGRGEVIQPAEGAFAARQFLRRIFESAEHPGEAIGELAEFATRLRRHVFERRRRRALLHEVHHPLQGRGHVPTQQRQPHQRQHREDQPLGADPRDQVGLHSGPDARAVHHHFHRMGLVRIMQGDDDAGSPGQVNLPRSGGVGPEVPDPQPAGRLRPGTDGDRPAIGADEAHGDDVRVLGEDAQGRGGQLGPLRTGHDRPQHVLQIAGHDEHVLGTGDPGELPRPAILHHPEPERQHDPAEAEEEHQPGGHRVDPTPPAHANSEPPVDRVTPRTGRIGVFPACVDRKTALNRSGGEPPTKMARTTRRDWWMRLQKARTDGTILRRLSLHSTDGWPNECR